MKDYQEIKAGATLRLAKRLMFEIQYKNPGRADFECFEAMLDKVAAADQCRKISQIIHDKPIINFPIVRIDYELHRA